MKKILLILLAVSLLVVSTAACTGAGAVPTAEADGIVPLPDVIDPEEEAPTDPNDLVHDNDGYINPDLGGDNSTMIAEFFSVTGVVTGMEERDGLRRVEIEDLDENPAVLVLNEDTIFPFSEDFAVGDMVTGWYLSHAPMIMIWPPEYSIDVFVSRMGDERNIKVDRFTVWEADTTEGYKLSQDGMLAFKVNEDTEIVLADGQDFRDGSLDNRNIIVIYGISTRSIPEQTTAEKLIVLFENIVPIG